MDKRNVDIVLVRMDKIGDLVLSLPVDEHPVFSGLRVHWFVSKGMEFVAERAVPKRATTAWIRRFTLPRLIAMAMWLRRERPRTIVLLHNPWWVSCAAWIAGVPERIGRRSQWHGFLFVNLPIRQKRSASDRSELDFNFDLVEWGFNRLGVRSAADLSRLKSTHLRLAAPSPKSTQDRLNLRAGEYRVVHPGMAGSALNWPMSSWKRLVEDLIGDLPVVITGTKSDKRFLTELTVLKDNPRVHWLVEKLNTDELLDVLSGARAVIAPSTGVLHLAASVDVPVLGLYSPRKVEHPRRWGPKGRRVRVLLPEHREGNDIPSDVLSRIQVQDVISALRELEAGNDADHLQTQPRI